MIVRRTRGEPVVDVMEGKRALAVFIIVIVMACVVIDELVFRFI